MHAPVQLCGATSVLRSLRHSTTANQNFKRTLGACTMLKMCTLSALAMCACAVALERNNGLEAALQDSHAACDARDKELQEALVQLVRCLPTLQFSLVVPDGTAVLHTVLVDALFACQSSSCSCRLIATQTITC